MNRQPIFLIVLLLLVSIPSLVLTVQGVEAGGTIYIRPDGSIDPPTASMSRNGDLYTFVGDITNESIVIQKDSITIDGAGYTMDGGNSILKGIYLSSRNNITIRNVRIVHFVTGVDLDAGSSNNVITRCDITENNNGMYFESSSNNHNTVSENNIKDNTDGINIYYNSSYNTIVGNNISSGDLNIRIESSSYNNVTENNLDGSAHYGMGVVASSSYNIISENNITGNGYIGGIWLGSSSSHSNITGNNIFENVVGIIIEDSVVHTEIFHNGFVNNTKQIDVENSASAWDNGYPSGGNYWSDYNGTDADQDGIGDTEYVINANNTDRNPLMGIFSDFAATSEHHVQTICNSTITDFQYNGTATSFNVIGKNDTTGFCRICIPTTLMSGNCTVFVNYTKVNSTLLPCSDTNNSYVYFDYELSTKNTLKDRADINKDRIVDMLDAAILSWSFGTRPGDPRWNPEADLNDDGVINNLDVNLLASVFFERTDIAEYQVTIIPEFPSFVVLSLLMMATLLTVILCKRKRAKLSRATCVF